MVQKKEVQTHKVPSSTKNGRNAISQERVRELFSYDETTGDLYWRDHPWFKHKSGTKVGYPVTGGSLGTKISQKFFFLHHLVWIFHNGAVAGKRVLHKNNIRTDNRIENLFIGGADGRLTQERVKELFNYDETTGILTRKLNIHGKNQHKNSGIGDIVGCKSSRKGYMTVNVDGKLYQYHHIVWMFLYGYKAENPIDHRDRHPENNTPHNIREVSHQCNSRNTKVYCNNKTGVKGVHWAKKNNKWCVTIRVYKTFYVGIFDDFTEAVCHRYAAETCLNWNDCDANSSAHQYLKQQGIIK